MIYFGCCNIILTSCSTVPITDRRQLKLIPESKLNAQAALIYEKVKKKEKLSDYAKTLNKIKEIGKKIENAIKNTLTLTRFFINLRWITFLNYVIKIYV